MSENSSSAESIFFTALETSVEERVAYLDQACGQNAKLRTRVEKLLAAQPHVGAFLEEPLSHQADAFDRPESREGPGTRIGHFKLLQEIGEGGFGIVYMAEQLEPVRRQVALKIIKPGMDTRDVIARFEAERQALALMDHANIARIFDAGATESGRPYFVMELVKGVPITEFCDKNDFETRRRLELFITVCRAVQHAHQKGVIHRDLKPSNIMVTLHDGDPVPKVIDFGVSKAISQRLTEKTLFTRYGQMVGTPQYMSPEQAEMSGLDVDTRSDIYSLGVILYELLTGTAPLESERLRTAGYSELLRMIQQEEPAKPSTRLSTLGDSLTVVCEHRKTDAKRLRQLICGDLDWIVMKAMEKHRDRRYETANGLAMDIQRHLNEEPVVAGPPSAAYRLSKMVRRNRVAFIAAFTVATALVIGLAAATWGFVHANYHRGLAEERLVRAMNAEEEAVKQRDAATEARRLANDRAAELERRIYLVHLGNADDYFRERDYSRTRTELNKCPIGQRGWEWRFLKRRLESIVPLELPGVEKPIYSGDGKRLIAIGAGSLAENKARIWDTTTGELVAELEQQNRLTSLALSSDGKQLAGGAENGELTLWDIKSKRSVWTVKKNERMFDGLAFSPDGKLIAAANWDGTLQVFETESGSVRFSLPCGDTVRKPVFSPDGAWIAVAAARAGEDKTAVLVNVSTGEIASHFPAGTKVPTFSPDGRIAAGNGPEITLWNWDGEKLTKDVSWMTADAGIFTDLCFNAEGTRLASAVKFSGQVQVWDVANQDKLAEFDGKGAFWLGMHPTKPQVAIPINSGQIRLWDYTGRTEGLVKVTLPDPPRLGKFSPDGKWIAVDASSHVSVLDAESGKLVRAIDGDLGRYPWMPDSRRILVSVETQNALELHDVLTGGLSKRFQGQFEPQQRSYVSQDGSQVTSITVGCVMRAWDVPSEQLKQEFTVPLPAHVALLGFGDCSWGTRMAIGFDGRLEFWDTATATKTDDVLQVPGRKRMTIVFSLDGKRVAVGGESDILTLHDIASGRELSRFTSHGHSQIALNPDGTQLMASGSNGVTIWDVASSQPLITLDGQALDWSPDNKRIAVGTSDELQIWTLPPPP